MKHKVIIKSFFSAALFSAMVLLTGCIKNDIPYPYIQAEFLSIEAEGEISPAVIDSKAQTVTLNLGENVNLSDVKIKSYSITEDASISPSISDGINLTNPFEVVLSLYQDYTWTIKANQPIERYFNIDGQVGVSTIDVTGKRVIAYISKEYGVKNVYVKSIKLGPAGVSTMEPNLNGKTVNFSAPVKVQVKYFDVVEDWTIYIDVSDVSVSTKSVDAWTNVAWAYGSAQEGKNNGFEYKKESDTEWVKVPEEWVTHNGGNFSARIIHLDSDTKYIVRAYSDEDYGDEITVRTEGYIEIPNASFDNWWLNGKVWNPWSEGGTPYWDTGNRGATTLGQSNSVPSDETWNGGPGKSAELQTKFVGIGTIGKLAAGNLFTGDFLRVDGTNGVLDFGRLFSGRPTKLKGYFKYTTAPIDYYSSELSYMKSKPDTAVVYMALADWDEPLEIRTNPKNRQLFDKNDPHVIAYGEVKYGYTVEQFTPFEIELDYRATDRVPKYVVIVCTASKYGDYFTGGAGSVLFVDNFSLEWDY